jgi:hypothetical protein
MANIKISEILDNIRQVSISASAMSILREFERVIDENGLYAFHNWKTLELVAGPEIAAYRVQCTFSSPLSKMPDPSGASRLLPYGVKVGYRKAWLVYPVKIEDADDFRPKIKKAKLKKMLVWLITINMPRFLMKDITQGSEEIMDSEIDMDDIDSTNIEKAYSEDLDTHAGAQKAAEEQNQAAQ